MSLSAKIYFNRIRAPFSYFYHFTHRFNFNLLLFSRINIKTALGRISLFTDSLAFFLLVSCTPRFPRFSDTSKKDETEPKSLSVARFAFYL